MWKIHKQLNSLEYFLSLDFYNLILFIVII